MGKVISCPTTQKGNNDTQRKYTADDIVSLLSHIEELKESSVYCLRHYDGTATFIVGHLGYRFDEEPPVE